MNWPQYSGQLADIEIPTEVLSLIPQKIMEQYFLMPVELHDDGCLIIVTSRFSDIFGDIASIEKKICRINPQVKYIKLLATSYDNFKTGYNSHFKQQFTPVIDSQVEKSVKSDKVTSEQTKQAENILQLGIEQSASDIHITPTREGPTKVEFRIDGKIRDSGIVLKREDAITICNIYKRNAKIEVNNLICQDGRFTFLGRDFRLSTQPYGGDNISNKIVLRILGSSDNIKNLDELSLGNDEVIILRRLIHKPSGIILVCGPTGEGKSTTLYSCLKEIRDTTNSIITTIEDPIEKFIPGIAQTQVRIAENDSNSLTFDDALRCMLRQDPDVIMVGEIRDKATAITSVQGSQTGHLILSTLHVRNSISVFRRLNDMGANVSGFAEQIVGISSQRLLSVNCPHCRRRIVSKLNSELRGQDLELLEYGTDDNGQEGYISYISTGCEKCDHTGFAGRIPIIEIIAFDNYLRDYFAEKHGLVEIERYLRQNNNFKSLWDKGIQYAANGTVSLEELLNTIEVDIDISQPDLQEGGCIIV